jgi:hypothetical protein
MIIIKMNCRSAMYIVGFLVPGKQIRNISGSNISRFSLSTRCVTAANSIYTSLDVINKHTAFPEDTFPSFNPTEFMVPVTSLVCYLHCFVISYLIFRLVLVLAYSLALVMYTFSVRQPRTSRRWKTN